jgi:hypothetical protein
MRSPLTDLRALSSSLAFHVALLLLTSVAALRVAMPSAPPEPKTLQAELGPIDNRLHTDEGGGAPDALGSQGMPDPIRITPGGRAARESVTDSLLAEALPRLSETMPGSGSGPLNASSGLLPGPGTGGGGGEGGGAGGGIGRGIGPSTEFFGARERASSFSYVIDCSGSMTGNDALGLAKRELLASLDQLPPDARFGVIFYNLEATELPDADGRPGLMPATARNKERVRTRLAAIRSNGGTDPVKALNAAFAQKAEVVFFLTDGQELTKERVRDLREAARTARVLAIEFGHGPSPGTADPLKTLALETGGSYRYIDVSRFRRP